MADNQYVILYIPNNNYLRNKLASGFFEILLPRDYADVNELRYIKSVRHSISVLMQLFRRRENRESVA